jgi:signal transduction histidine kinase
VVSFSEAILEGMDGDISDLVRTDVETIKEHGRQALQTLTMLLDIAKLEMGQFEPTFERLDPLPLFRKAVDYATSLRPQVQLQGVIEDRLPAIVGDAQHLPQLFEPPLVNAVLSAKNVLMEIRQNGGDLVVRIEDDRNPLPSSIESLFRNHLRLLLSYHLARLHKGELTFDTKNGFVFLLRIPGA